MSNVRGVEATDDDSDIEILPNALEISEADLKRADNDEEDYLMQYGDVYKRDYPNGLSTRNSKSYLKLQNSRRSQIQKILSLKSNEDLIAKINTFASAQKEFEMKKAEESGVSMQMQQYQSSRIDGLNLQMKLTSIEMFRWEEIPKGYTNENYYDMKAKQYTSNLKEATQLNKEIVNGEEQMRELWSSLKFIYDNNDDAEDYIKAKNDLIECATGLGLDIKTTTAKDLDFLRLFPYLDNYLMQFRMSLRKERRLLKKENEHFNKKDYDRLELTREQLKDINRHLVQLIEDIDIVMAFSKKYDEELSDFNFFKETKKEDVVEKSPQSGTSSQKSKETVSCDLASPPQKKQRTSEEEIEQPSTSAHHAALR